MKNENKYECNAVVIKWHGSKHFLKLWSVKHDKSHDQSIEIVCGRLQKYLHTAVHNILDPTHRFRCGIQAKSVPILTNIDPMTSEVGLFVSPKHGSHSNICL